MRLRKKDWRASQEERLADGKAGRRQRASGLEPVMQKGQEMLGRQFVDLTGQD